MSSGIRIKTKFLIAFIIAIATTYSLFVVWMDYAREKSLEQVLVQQAEALAELMDSTWEFMSVNQDLINYTSDGIYEFKELSCSIAGNSISRFFTNRTDYSISYVNFNPRNPSNNPDDFETTALTLFTNNSETLSYYEFAEIGDETVFRYAKPMIATNHCLACHGNPVGEIDETGFPKEGWTVGAVGGAISISIPLDIYEKSSWGSTLPIMAYFLLLLLVTALIIYVAVDRLVISPLGRMQTHFSGVGKNSTIEPITSLPKVESSLEMNELVESFDAMAQTINESHERLESEIQARTQELKEANERLEQESRYKSDLLAIFSHELKTPLASTALFIDIMQESESLDEEEKEMLARMKANNQSLLLTINDILDAARLKAGQAELEYDSVDIGALAESAVLAIEPLSSRKDIEVTLEIDSTTPPIFSDGGKLRRVVDNLMSNAVKFTPSGGSILLQVTTDTDAGLVSLSVSDTGIGISDDDIERIFEKFVQGDMSIAREYSGSGLGLAIAHDYVTILGGTIHALSKLGEGSTFTITLPVVPREDITHD